MQTNRKSKTALATAVALATGLIAQQTGAQVIEEVLVTATKRATGLQDVPIALSVVGGDKIIEQGISNLEDLAVFIPNVQISEGVANPNIFIRGIGSGVNDGFEQSVGTFVDGVYFGRGQAARTTFLDVERVEVLKGSQSTLFGKNTIAGALNITTAKPSDSFEGSIELTTEPLFGGKSGTIVLSGPLSDSFGARFVYKSEQADGFMDNSATGREEMEEDSKVGRLTLTWQPNDDLSLALKYEAGEYESVGTNQKITIATLGAVELYGLFDPSFPDTVGFNTDKSDATFGDLGGARRGENYGDVEWAISTLTVDWSIGDYDVKSITGYIDYDTQYLRDADYSPIPFLSRYNAEIHTQFTQEFWIASPASDTFEFLAGVYYQDEDLEIPRFTDAVFSTLGAPVPDGTTHNKFQQDSETLSAFFQGTYHFRDDLRMVAGIRYSKDKKEFQKFQFHSSPFSDVDDPLPDDVDFLNVVFGAGFDIKTHTFANGVAETCVFACETAPIDTVRDENHTVGDLTLQWDANADVMLYAKYGTGYKAGGFDEDNGAAFIPGQQYEDETSESIELGAKMDLLGGSARLNVAAFYSEFDDVQVSSFDGSAGFVVGNAAKTVSQGIELDAAYAITDSLTVTAALALLDASYDDFKDGPCTVEQDMATPPGEACRQDLSGERLLFAADVSGNLSINYDTNLTDALKLNLGADLFYTDDFSLSVAGEEQLVQDAYTKLNARISIGAPDGKWSVSLLGKNLTDEVTTVFASDIPLGAAIGVQGTFFSVVEAPRSYELQAIYRF